MLSKQEAREMAELPSLSYYTSARSNTSTTDPSWAYQTTTATDWHVSNPYQQGGLGVLGGLGNNLQQMIGQKRIEATLQPTKQEPILARLIRYFVIDPHPQLAEQAPERSILMQGTVMLNGQDDRGFLLEMAPKLAEKLVEHNVEREKIEYVDKDQKKWKLKPIKLSNLDFIIEVVKEYK